MARSFAPVSLAAPTFGDEEIEAVREVLASGWVAGQGPRGAQLEERWAAHCGVDHAVAVNNCTAGLHLALLALGVGPGDEVLVADYTFPATGHAVMYTGATPVFVDVRRDTATIDPDLVGAAVKPKTVGIIAVDALGQAADYEPLQKLADQHGLFLLEDAACSMGATYRGRATGAFGDVAAFSLHARKGITSGEGGVVTTARADIAAAVRKRSCFGMESAWSRELSDHLPVPVFDELGYNYKLSDILASVALVQLDRLDVLLSRRRTAAARYRELLSHVPHVDLPAEAEDREHVWQTFAVTVNPPLDRDGLVLDLRREGVQCYIGTYASHLQPVYGSTQTCPESARLLRRHLALPMHANLSAGDVECVAAVFAAAVGRQLDRA